jgi:hypothetical protein
MWSIVSLLDVDSVMPEEHDANCVDYFAGRLFIALVCRYGEAFVTPEFRSE